MLVNVETLNLQFVYVLLFQYSSTQLSNSKTGLKLDVKAKYLFNLSSVPGTMQSVKANAETHSDLSAVSGSPQTSAV